MSTNWLELTSHQIIWMYTKFNVLHNRMECCVTSSIFCVNRNFEYFKMGYVEYSIFVLLKWFNFIYTLWWSCPQDPKEIRVTTQTNLQLGVRENNLSFWQNVPCHWYILHFWKSKKFYTYAYKFSNTKCFIEFCECFYVYMIKRCRWLAFDECLERLYEDYFNVLYAVLQMCEHVLIICEMTILTIAHPSD